MIEIGAFEIWIYFRFDMRYWWRNYAEEQIHKNCLGHCSERIGCRHCTSCTNLTHVSVKEECGVSLGKTSKQVVGKRKKMVLPSKSRIGLLSLWKNSASVVFAPSATDDDSSRTLEARWPRLADRDGGAKRSRGCGHVRWRKAKQNFGGRRRGCKKLYFVGWKRRSEGGTMDRYLIFFYY